MPRVLLAAAGLVALLASSSGAQVPVASPCDLSTTERVVAVGDVHGALESFVAILREAALIDQNRRWVGGRAVLVQLGDVLDRGPDSKRVMDLLRGLEAEAVRAGGQVYPLNGNHELMRMTDDRRYVSAKEYAAFATPDSRDLRDKLYASAADDARGRAKVAKEKFDESAFRRAFYADTPLGFVEMYRAFEATGEYGRLLRGRGIIVRINGVLYVHGGISPAIAGAGCAAINARARAELQGLGAAGAVEPQLLGRADGPLWYRGLVDDTASEAEVAAVLEGVGARAMVVAHTVTTDNAIQARFGGRVVAIDTGMLAGEFFPNGVPSALEIKDGQATAIYLGKRTPLGKITDR